MTMTETSSHRKRDSHIFDRDKLDHYVEPGYVSKRLFDVESFRPTHLQSEPVILDPCCGWGRIPTAAIEAGYQVLASDIAARWACDWAYVLDFFDPKAEYFFRTAQSVVTNPPFDRIEEVARRACELASYKVALICPLRRLPAAKWLRDLPLKKIWVMTPRPSMPSGEHIRAGGRIGGGTQDFVWLIFEKGCDHGCPEMDWLHRDK